MKITQEKLMNNLSRPMLPQSTFLLPGGKARLRAFSSRCLKTISIAAKEEGGILKFPFSEHNDDGVLFGSLVVIEDFNQGKDGVLELDVLCTSLVEITASKRDENHILFANIEMINHWSQQMEWKSVSENILASALNNIINQDTRLNSLYKNRVLNNSSWVIARWIELLPVNVDNKRCFINRNSYKQAQEFIESIIF